MKLLIKEMKMNKTIILILSILFTFTACSKNKPNEPKINLAFEKKEIPKKKTIIKPKKVGNLPLPLKKTVHINQALLDFYSEWKDTKYLFGGNSKKGIDCSAFTQRFYRDKLNLEISRTTLTQVKKGEEISTNQLTAGDLIFFKTGINSRHVGLYMGDGTFMHASIKGVRVTRINKSYYKNKYWTARRIIY